MEIPDDMVVLAIFMDALHDDLRLRKAKEIGLDAYRGWSIVTVNGGM